MRRVAMLAMVPALLASLACSRDSGTASSPARGSQLPPAAASIAPDTAPASRPPATAVESPAREAEATASIDADQQAALDVIRSYYRAIDAREFEKAYRFWGSRGAQGRTLKEFAAGFADTVSTHAETGEPSSIGAAAGSRYIEIPVKVTATTRGGESQHFEGTYTLRRTVVDGASASDRAWHIDHASMREVRSKNAR